MSGQVHGSLLFTFNNISGINDISLSTSAGDWVASGITPTFISSTSFSVPGDQRSAFQVYRRVKTVNNIGTQYGSILTATYASGKTTITILNDLSNTLDLGLSSVSYGFIESNPPSIYPQVFSGTPLAAPQLPMWLGWDGTNALMNIGTLNYGSQWPINISGLSQTSVLATTATNALQAPNQTAGTNTALAANTAYVDSVGAIVSAPTRAIGSTYTNSSGRSMTVTATIHCAQTSSGPSEQLCQVVVNGVIVGRLGQQVTGGSAVITTDIYVPVTFVVPNGLTYGIYNVSVVSGTTAIDHWIEQV
jgi:hypothetical protein